MLKTLALVLLAAPAFANTLRGTSPQSTASRQLQTLELDADQIAYTIVLDMELAEGSDVMSGLEEDLTNIKAAVDNWMEASVIAPVDALNDTWTMDVCVSSILQGSWVPPYKHSLSIRYICEFEELTAPPPLAFIESLKTEASSALGQAALETAVEDSDSLYDTAVSVSTTTSSISWVQVGSNNRDAFDNAYVLPYTISWSFTTPPILAGQVEYDATKNATIDWIEENWDIQYPPTSNFARRNVQVNLRYGSFSPLVDIYQQSVSYGVEILIGADNITDVPSVTAYTTAMQLFYPISNFTQLLNGYLPEGSVFRQSTQTTFALTPTFEVSSLSDSTSRLDPTPDPDVEVVNYAVVSVNINPNGV